MGIRCEPRIRASLQVNVYGIDLNGNFFKQTAQAYNVSRHGACLDGIGCLRGPGEVIEIEHRGEKAGFVVAWVGIPGTPEHNRIGVRNRDQRNIWKLHLPTPEPDNFQPYDSESEATQPRSDEFHSETRAVIPQFLFKEQTGHEELEIERRRYRRYAIEGSATFQVKNSNVRTWGRLSDLSSGGCYVESYVPFPVKTELQMMLEVREVRVVAEGVVRVVYPGLGMGIEFTRLSRDSIQELEQVAASEVPRN